MSAFPYTLPMSRTSPCPAPARSPCVAWRGAYSRTCIVSRSNRGSDGPGSGSDDVVWAEQGFPSYLQKTPTSYNLQTCQDFDRDIREAEAKAAGKQAASLAAESGAAYAYANVWQAIRKEAEKDAASEPLLSSFLYASILVHDTFERALSFVLANRLANSVLLPTQLFEIFHDILMAEENVRASALADIEACRERDPACVAYSQALLYFKGFHAIQAQRVAHALWGRGQKVLALALQSRISEVFSVDIHPAARFGRGILLDHGTGVVIGETAVIGDNCSLLQNVTLGGTGKEVGDRHPKIAENVLIGASATILGNITVGTGAQIAAGSLVLKPVPPNTMMAGSPAKEVGKVTGIPAHSMQQWNQKSLQDDPCADEPGASGQQPAAAAAVGAAAPLKAPAPQPAVAARPAVPAPPLAPAAAPSGHAAPSRPAAPSSPQPQQKPQPQRSIAPEPARPIPRIQKDDPEWII